MLLVTFSNACCCCCCCWLAAVLVSMPQQLPPAASSGGTSCEGNHKSSHNLMGQRTEDYTYVQDLYKTSCMTVDVRQARQSDVSLKATSSHATDLCGLTPSFKKRPHQCWTLSVLQQWAKPPNDLLLHPVGLRNVCPTHTPVVHSPVQGWPQRSPQV